MGFIGLFTAVISILGSAEANAEPKPVPVQLSEQVTWKDCEAGQCWANLFPAVAEATPDALKAIQAYEARLESLDERSTQVDPSDTEGMKAALQFRLRLASASLEQCEDLRDGGGTIRHLIILGHAFSRDGGNFRLAAEDVRKKKVAELCGRKKGAERKVCEAQVVIVEDMGKNDLASFLDLLGPDSVDGVSYVGHGIENAIGVGGRNILLPYDWSPMLSISKDQWLEHNQGMLYAEDLSKEFGTSLVRVLKKQASVDIYACKAGGYFGPKFHERTGATVSASVNNMHFEWVGSDGKRWRADPDAPRGAWIELVPDEQGGAKGRYGVVGKARAPASTGMGPATLAAVDRATQNVTARLMKGSDNGPIWIESRKQALFFSSREREFFIDVLEKQEKEADIHEGTWRDRNIGYLTIIGLLERRVRAAPANRKDDYLLAIEKLKICIDESVRLYYLPGSQTP